MCCHVYTGMGGERGRNLSPLVKHFVKAVVHVSFFCCCRYEELVSSGEGILEVKYFSCLLISHPSTCIYSIMSTNM